MRDSLIKGAKALKNFDIDIDNTALSLVIDHLHIYPFHSGEEFPLHAHPNFEFHYIASGKGKLGLIDMDSLINSNDIVTLPGFSQSCHIKSIPEYRIKLVSLKKMLEFERTFNVKTGDLFINPPKQFHWQNSDKEDPIIEYSIRCSFDVPKLPFPEMRNMAEEFTKIRQLLINETNSVYEDKYGIKELFESIFEEAYYKMPGFIAKVKYLLQVLIINFARHTWNKRENLHNTPEFDYNTRRLQSIKAYVKENMHRNITIGELSQAHYMSTRTLSRFIKKEANFSVHQFILKMKVDEALEIISKTNCKLSEVAMLTGFSSPYHLSNTIKKIKGKSPSQYR